MPGGLGAAGAPPNLRGNTFGAEHWAAKGAGDVGIWGLFQLVAGTGVLGYRPGILNGGQLFGE